MSYARFLGRHVTKQLSDWPELLGMTRTKESAKDIKPPFCGHFVSRSAGMGTRLGLVHETR